MIKEVIKTNESSKNFTENSNLTNKSAKLQTAEYRHITKQSSLLKKYYYAIKKIDEDNIEITMKSGSKYYGQVNSRNDRHGFGKYVHRGGGTYEGYWINGFKSGEGKFWNRTGILNYEGTWECGEPHGEGKIYNNKGVLVYSGLIVNGKTQSKNYWSDLCK